MVTTAAEVTLAASDAWYNATEYDHDTNTWAVHFSGTVSDRGEQQRAASHPATASGDLFSRTVPVAPGADGDDYQRQLALTTCSRGRSSAATGRSGGVDLLARKSDLPPSRRNGTRSDQLDHQHRRRSPRASVD